MLQFFNLLRDKFNLSEKIMDLFINSYMKIQGSWQKVDEITAINQLKILNAFQKHNVSDFYLNGSTGYGYGDIGRDILENIWADIFNADKALVRSQIVSGTHAIALCLFGVLRPNDKFVSITGAPYDTLQKVIGNKGEPGTLSELNIHHKVVELDQNGEFDWPAIEKTITKDTKMVCIQRSRGYSWRPSVNVMQIKKAIEFVKAINPEIICFVDNCYGEFVETIEPNEVGADLVAGSLIKNPGGGIAPRGGYVAGKENLVNLASARLTAPGIAGEVGSSLDFNRLVYQGLFMAPLIVQQALKGAIFAAQLLGDLGYCVSPEAKEPRTDIIQGIKLESPEKMRLFCKGLQKASPIDAHVNPEESFLPGYQDAVIMAGGTFIQGSSIELSADGPIREPYIIYLQGGLSLSHILIGLASAIKEMERINNE
ncbi:MAG: aminotransferase class I/II-fold pyridoxal phosphate-dependent enzyme [Peptococcales bacterium]|jgi:cystathionine beta-lyase family protein involved in aluminum resistance